MPTQRARLTRTEAQDYRTRLLRLREMGIEVGSDGDFLQGSEKLRQPLILEVDEELAKIYDLPGDGFIFVGCAKQRVCRRFLNTDFEMTVSWDDLPLNLDDPEGSAFYSDVIAGLYPLLILNPWLTGESPLCYGQREGLIIARGQRSVPSEYHDDTVVTVKLLLWDERGNELCFTFQARVDRSLKRKYERQQAERRRRAPQRQPIFKREKTDPSRTTQDEGPGSTSPPAEAVSAPKSMEGSSPDAPRDETDEPSGAV